MLRRLLWLAVLAIVAPVSAQDVHEGFDDPALDARYRAFTETIRCMKCQNQSIADSPVDQADDVKRLIRVMMIDGKTDAEIRTYLISRYGDFISYVPPFKPSTWVLWGAPALLLLGGGFVFARILRSHMRQPLDDELEA